LVARTGEAGSKGLSLLVLETQDLPGFRVGRRLEKLGQHASDTAELSFEGVRVPADQLLGGKEGLAFGQLMNQLPFERLLIAVPAAAVIERALELTVEYCQQRKVFGQRLYDLQNTRFKLAKWPPWRTWCAASSMTAPSAWWMAPWTTRRPTWPSGGAPSSSAGPPTNACSCSAAMAT